MKQTDFKLKIKLYSDTCCGSGEGNAVFQDIKSCYDDMGFPVIQGRRIKGLLREKAVFLKEYGYKLKGTSHDVNDELIINVFGNGAKEGGVRIGNAYIENYKEILAEIKSCDDSLKKIISPGAVERVYTVDRSSTSIQEGKETAKTNSLRLIGAFPKGSNFEADISLSFDKNTPEYELFETCVKLLRNIGINKSRGYGEAVCALEETKNLNCTKDLVSGKIPDTGKCRKCRIRYSIDILENVISENGYIEGAKVQGWFAGMALRSKGEEFDITDFLLNIKFGNAYPSENKKIYYPVPLGMKYEKNKTDTLYSMSDGFKIDKDKQYVKASGYMLLSCDNNAGDNDAAGKFCKKDVYHGLEYHFNEKSKLIYSIKSLSAGQSYSGYIEADKYADVLADIVRDSGGVMYIGASKKSQYAGCRIKLEMLGEEKVADISGENFVFELLSDAVLFDDTGINSISKEVLEDNIKAQLSVETDTEDITIENIYTAPIYAGGYNTKWGLPKRRYMAFIKGTQINISSKAAISVSEHGFIGGMQEEGYGEYRIRETGCKKFKELKPDSIAPVHNVGSAVDKSKKLISDIILNILLDSFRAAALEKAVEYLEKNKPSSSCAMRLIDAYKSSNENEFYIKFKEYVNTNYKGNNNEEIKKFADEAIKDFDRVFEKIEDDKSQTGFTELKRSTLNAEKNKLFKAYIRDYIAAAKYSFKEGKK